MIITLFFGHEALVIIFLAAFELTRLLPFDDSCSFGDCDKNRDNRLVSFRNFFFLFRWIGREASGPAGARLDYQVDAKRRSELLGNHGNHEQQIV